MHDELGFEPLVVEEKALESTVAQIIRFLRAIRPNLRQPNQKVFVGIPDPQTGLRSEPIQASQPLGGCIHSWVIEDSRTMVACLRGNLLLPLMPRPLPLALVDEANRLKPQTHGVVFQLKGKLGSSLMGDTQFIPKIAFFDLRMLA